MPKTFQGKIIGKDRKFGIVISRFNQFISSKLLEGALDCFQRHQVSAENIDIAWVPGSFEVPSAARRLADTGRHDAVICLGALIRGATPHFDYIASEVAKGVARVGEGGGIPAIFGVVTADSQEQAIEELNELAEIKMSE